MVNKKAFDALPQDLQEIVLDAARKCEDKAWAIVPQAQEKARSALEAGGIEFLTVDPAEDQKFKDAAQDIWDIWAKRSGTVAQEVLEAVKKAQK